MKFRIALATGLAFLIALVPSMASAVTASPGEFSLQGSSAVVSDPAGPGNVVRIPTDSTGSSASTTVFQTFLNANPSTTITVCAKYLSNQNGWAVAPHITNGVWEVELPPNFSRTIYHDNCVNITNSSTQPLGKVVVTENLSTSLLIKNVRIF